MTNAAYRAELPRSRRGDSAAALIHEERERASAAPGWGSVAERVRARRGVRASQSRGRACALPGSVSTRTRLCGLGLGVSPGIGRGISDGGVVWVFASRKARPRGDREPHEAAEDVFGTGAERDYRLDVGRRARAQRACDLDCGASLTALTECDGVRPTLVGARLASRAFRAIERRGRGGFPCLSAQLRVSDASFGDQFDER